MRGSAAASTVLAAVLLAGCGGSSGSAAADASTSRGTVRKEVALSTAHLARESHLREHAAEIALESFPEAVDTEWAVVGFEHHGHMTNMTVEPVPAETVGYPRIRFAVSFADPVGPRTVAAYCQEPDGSYSMLFKVEPPKTAARE